MPNLKPMEILLLVVVLVVLFGAKRMPDAARGLGRSLRIFKSEIKGLQDDDAPAEPPTTTTAQQVVPPAIAPVDTAPPTVPPTAAPPTAVPAPAPPAEPGATAER